MARETPKSIDAYGISIELNGGWEGRIWRAPFDPEHPGERTYPVLHIANFALPFDNSHFGGPAISVMPRGGLFAALVEYGRPPRQGWFRFEGFPRRIDLLQLSEAYLRRVARPGQVGGQHFCTLGDRTFCLYVVALPPPARNAFPHLNQMLRTVTVGPPPESPA